jgi:uncharacterized repeat protein (TIGR01451 family)
MAARQGRTSDPRTANLPTGEAESWSNARQVSTTGQLSGQPLDQPTELADEATVPADDATETIVATDASPAPDSDAAKTELGLLPTDRQYDRAEQAPRQLSPHDDFDRPAPLDPADHPLPASQLMAQPQSLTQVVSESGDPSDSIDSEMRSNEPRRADRFARDGQAGTLDQLPTDPSTSTADDAPARVAVDRQMPRVTAARGDGAAGGDGSPAGDVVLLWTTPREVSIGQPVHCELLVCNQGCAAVRDVAVRAVLTSHVQLDAARPEPKRENQRQLVWYFEAIEPLTERAIELELTPQSEGEITPEATVTFTRASVARIQVLRAELELAIEGPPQIISGQAANYQFVVSNPGQGRAHNVVLEAELGEHLKCPEGDKLSYSVGTLDAGQSRTVQVPITASGEGTWPLAARATASGKLTAERQLAIEVVRPRLQVAIDGPRLRYVDRQATYTIRIHNPGPAPANNVQVFDVVPPGFRFVEASGGGTFDNSNRQVAWFVGRLEPGTTAEVGVQLIPTETGPKRVAAAVKADSGVAEQAETETRVEGIAAVVLDVVDTDDPIEVGGHTTYEIRVTNRGTLPANQVQVAARLPEQLEVVDASGPTSGKLGGTQIVFEPIRRLNAGQSEVYRLRVLCRQQGQAGLKAYFRSAEQTKPVVEEEVTQIYQD